MKKSIMELFGGTTDLDQRSAGMLVKAIQDNNLEGFDYLEFKQSLSGLAKIHADENTRFQSAYVTASTLGLTKNRLLETAEFYKKIIQKERLKFDQAAQHQIEKGIGVKRKEADQLEAIIAQKQKEIEKLQEEISTHQQKVNKLKEELGGAKQKIQAAQSSFHNACEVITQHINGDMEKINTFIS